MIIKQPFCFCSGGHGQKDPQEYMEAKYAAYAARKAAMKAQYGETHNKPYSGAYAENKNSTSYGRREDKLEDLKRYEDSYHPGLGGYSYRRQPGKDRLSPKYERYPPRRSASPPGPARMRYGSPPPPERGGGGYDRYENRMPESRVPEPQYNKPRYREMDSPPPERPSYREHSRSKYTDEAPMRGYTDTYMKRYIEDKPRSSRGYSPVGSDISGGPVRGRSRSPVRGSSKYGGDYMGKGYSSSNYGSQMSDYGYRNEKRRKVYDWSKKGLIVRGYV